MLAFDEIINHAALDRAGPVERIQGGQVFNRVWVVAAQHVSHAVRFKLEDAGGESAVEDFFVGFLVFEWYVVKRDECGAGAPARVFPLSLGDQLERVIENGQRGQSKEVHLEQAHLLDRDHVEGGDDFVVLGLVQRNQFDERPRRNHHTRRVHARVADQSFEFPGGVQQLPHLWIFVVGLLHLC